MRLKQIKIIHFGQLSNLTFNLPSNDLNVFFGENEAGKSTTVAFIKQVMFGFYLRSNSSPFFEDYQPLAHVSPMGGSLLFEDEDGTEFKLERLWAKGDKSKRGSLTVMQGEQQVPENVFFDRLHNIDGNFYTDSFIFNQEMLSSVTSLSQADLLERIYYLGAANSGQLLQLRDGFAKDAGKLFKKTGKKPEVNRLLKEVDDARAELKQAEEQFQTYEGLAASLKEAQSSEAKQQEEQKKLQAKRQEIKALEAQVGNFKQLNELEKQSKKIQFDSQNYQQAQELVAQQKNLANQIAGLEKRIASFQDENEVDQERAKTLLQKKPELLAWQTELKQCEQSQEQLKTEEQQLENLNPDLHKILSMTDEELKQLQTDFKELPKEEKEVVPAKNPNNYFWYLAGIVIAFLGLTQMTTNPLFTVIGLFLGIGLIGYGFYQQKQAQAKKQKDRQKFLHSQHLRTQFQEKYGLEPTNLNLHDLLTARNQYQIKEQSFERNTARLSQINQAMDNLAQQLQKLLKQPISNEYEAILAAMNLVNEQIRQSQARMQQLANLKNNLQDNNADLKELRLKLQAVLAKDHVADMKEYDERYQANLAQEKLQTQIKYLREQLGDQLVKLRGLDSEKLQADQSKLNQQLSELEQELQPQISAIAQLKVKMNDLADSDAVFTARQNLANKEAEFMKSSQEYLADLLAAKWIGRTLDLASNQRFPKMLAAARDYLKLLTGGRYVDLELSKKIRVIRFDGKKREVKYLSRGTAEQLYFALKFAYVEQVGDQINLPILIDDSFVNFDDQRISYIDQLLKKISQNHQVLIFTAQKSLVDKMQIKPLTFRKDAANA